MNGQIDQGRRDFLKVSAIAGVGLMVSCYWADEAPGAPTGSKGSSGDLLKPNAWIRIAPDNNITVMARHSEMGQGIMTGLAMLVAEELEADWSKVRAEHAPAAAEYVNPDFGVQATGGSTSVKTSWDVLRKAGASVRELMKNAAAKKWDLAIDELEAKESAVHHKGSNKSITYGELIDLAKDLEPPTGVPLKSPSQFRIIGKSAPRLDSEAKTEGRAVFGADFKTDGMLNALVLHSPTIGGKVKSMDPLDAKKVQGVHDILEISSGVAIVADYYYQALKSSKSLKIEWDKGDLAQLSNESIFATWKELSKKGGDRLREEGAIDNALKEADKVIEAEYYLPFQAHACPEPMNCTAYLQKERLDIWVPTQNQGGTQEVAAKESGLGLDQVFIHTTYLGGGFGRRGGVDFVREAIELTKKLKKPVKVMWTREEDIRNDYYRPASYHLIKGAFNEKKEPLGLYHLLVGPSQMNAVIEDFAPAMLPGWMPRPIKNIAVKVMIPVAKYQFSADGAASGAKSTSYQFPNLCVEYIEDDPGVPVMPWRSVGDSRNAFVMESFMDEMAQGASRDPVEFRIDLLKKAKRLRGVLELAAEKAEWGKENSNSVFKGVAVHEFHNTPVAMVAHISVSDKGEPKVQRVTAAVDCGLVINPQMVKSQIAGGIVFGLTAALKGAITIKDGKSEQTNFDDFPLLTMEETPIVDTHIIQSDDPPRGIGEVGVPPIAPAVANAVFAATGKRIRRLPLNIKG
jgi:CO/xanthine dehydrogenase Mo-binding subunit